MSILPKEIVAVLQHFESAFRGRVWRWATLLVVGTLLARGQRTVAAALRVLGREDERAFQHYHRVLNRARWSSRALSRTLLRLLLRTFVPPGAPVVVGIDDTIERRRGAKIAAKGIYRDPVRSSKGFFVKTSGLRWVSLQLLAWVPWAQRIWALPLLTVLAPSERYHQERGQRHKKLTDWGRQLLRQLRRWLPDRYLVAVADSSYAVLELLARCAGQRQPITIITRLRLDAGLYDPPPSRPAGRRGRPRKKGARQPTLAQRLTAAATIWETLTVRWYGGAARTIAVATGTALWYHPGLPAVPIRWVLVRDPFGKFAPQALLCTDLAVAAPQIVEWFVWRWQLEVTFHALRTHLGVETQRQWSDLAIARTTPALFGLFSVVTLVAHQQFQVQAVPLPQTAWYAKSRPTFVDALALVRRELWSAANLSPSPGPAKTIEIPRTLWGRLTNTLAYVA